MPLELVLEVALARQDPLLLTVAALAPWLFKSPPQL